MLSRSLALFLNTSTPFREHMYKCIRCAHIHTDMNEPCLLVLRVCRHLCSPVSFIFSHYRSVFLCFVRFFCLKICAMHGKHFPKAHASADKKAIIRTNVFCDEWNTSTEETKQWMMNKLDCMWKTCVYAKHTAFVPLCGMTLVRLIILANQWQDAEKKI